MPATITHAYFAKDVLEVLPEEIRSSINCQRMKMFGQSMDSLMFYNLISVFPGKKIRNFAHYFHGNQSQDYFISLIHYIKDNHLITDSDTCSYLAGMICHYVLDSTIHPFVFYKTGQFKKGDSTTYKYRNLHEFMETFLDNDMIRRREKNNPYRFPIGDFWYSKGKFSLGLKKAINYSFSSTFHIDHMSDIYFKSLKQMRFSLKFLRKDSTGMKRIVYKTIDSFTPKWFFRCEAISYHYPLVDRHNFLNSNHSLWRNPTTYSMTSRESFIELYLKAIKLAKVIICASFDYIRGKDIELEKIFLNHSYITGLNCLDKKELKYFEF